MPSIVITSVPPGEAPEDIRQAWVGIKLKLAAESSKPQQYDVVGILSGQNNWKSKLLRLLPVKARKVEKWFGYSVEFLPAIWSLENAGRMEAAHWWVTNTPELLRPGQLVIFPASCCHVEEQVDV